MDKKSSYNKQKPLDIVKDLWFFKCHFKNDQVIPECLELHSFWQLIGFYPSWAGGTGKWEALVVKELKLKGQVRLYHDKTIYFAKYLQVGLFEKLVWDSDMDLALDPF